MEREIKLTDEVLQVRQALFKDYINQRDRVKKAAKSKNLILNPGQEKRVLAMARRVYRAREVQRNAPWFQRFVHNVSHYYDTVKLGNWGSFRGQ